MERVVKKLHEPPMGQAADLPLAGVQRFMIFTPYGRR